MTNNPNIKGSITRVLKYMDDLINDAKGAGEGYYGVGIDTCDAEKALADLKAFRDALPDIDSLKFDLLYQVNIREECDTTTAAKLTAEAISENE